MAKSKKSIWLTVLSSGVVVALVTFVANKGWEIFEHRAVGPKYVDASVRFEDHRLLVFIRNNSDEPLDLTRATIAVDEPGLVGAETLGAYPDVSKLYSVSGNPGTSRLEVADNRLVVKLNITQAISPKTADQFGFTLSGLAGPVDLSKAKIRVELGDIKGNSYVAGP